MIQLRCLLSGRTNAPVIAEPLLAFSSFLPERHCCFTKHRTHCGCTITSVLPKNPRQNFAHQGYGLRLRDQSLYREHLCLNWAAPSPRPCLEEKPPHDVRIAARIASSKQWVCAVAEVAFVVIGCMKKANEQRLGYMCRKAWSARLMPSAGPAVSLPWACGSRMVWRPAARPSQGAAAQPARGSSLHSRGTGTGAIPYGYSRNG